MSTDTLEPAVKPTATPRPARRPLRKRILHWVRRGHLYMGLFLFPWAILYGFSAFLFNHPTAFSETPSVSFGADATAGTALESLPTPQQQAEAIVAKLNEMQKPTTPYALAGDAKYVRDTATASVRADGQTHTIFVDVKNGGGTIRTTPIRERKEPEKAPFAIGAGGGAGGRGRQGGAPAPKGGPPRKEGGSTSAGLKLDQPLPERIKEAIPTILERTGTSSGEISVTAVPDITFPIEADGRTWTASYNALTGSVAGTPTDAKPEVELGWRRFMLRLHTAHGYPSDTNSRWFWALVVDAMAFTMCFWGLSGLVMWWQIKATRKLGLVVLLFSAAAATALGIAMYTLMTA